MSTLRKNQSPDFNSSSLQKSFQNTSAINKRYTSLTQDQLQQVKQAFQLFDPHSTGSITYHEFKIILRALGFDVKKSQVVKLAKAYDIDETGKITFEDYLEIMGKKYSQRDPIEQALKAFKLFDTENKGKISLYDLKKVAKQLGQSLREEELIAMIEEFDRDGDGQIDEEEFLAIIKPSIV